MRCGGVIGFDSMLPLSLSIELFSPRRIFKSRRMPPPHSHAHPMHTDPQVPLRRPRGDEQGGQSNPPGARSPQKNLILALDVPRIHASASLNAMHT